MKGFKDSSGKFRPIKSNDTIGLKVQNNSNHVEGIRLKRNNSSGIKKKRAKLDAKQKSILRNWVEQNRDWKTIDDLPNEIFIPLVSPAKDDIDKRVAIQVEALDFMKQVTRELNTTRRKSRDFDDDEEEQEPIVAQFSLGETVMISPHNDNENYKEFRGKKLRITNVATNRDEHGGFDEGVGQALYNLETVHGKDVPFSLYDYELVSA